MGQALGFSSDWSTLCILQDGGGGGGHVWESGRGQEQEGKGCGYRIHPSREQD